VNRFPILNGRTNIVSSLDIAIPSQLLDIDIKIPRFDMYLVLAQLTHLPFLGRYESLSRVFRVEVFCDYCPRRVIRVRCSTRTTGNKYIALYRCWKNSEKGIIDVFAWDGLNYKFFRLVDRCIPIKL